MGWGIASQRSKDVLVLSFPGLLQIWLGSAWVLAVCQGHFGTPDGGHEVSRDAEEWRPQRGSQSVYHQQPGHVEWVELGFFNLLYLVVEFLFNFFLNVSGEDWREPLTEKKEDIAAAQYLVEAALGWFLGKSLPTVREVTTGTWNSYTDRHNMGITKYFGRNLKNDKWCKWGSATRSMVSKVSIIIPNQWEARWNTCPSSPKRRWSYWRKTDLMLSD